MSGRRGEGLLAAVVAFGLLAVGVPSCATLTDDAPVDVPALIEDAGGLFDRLTGGMEPSSDASAAGETASPNVDYYTVDGPADFTGATVPDPGAIAYGTPDMLGRSTRAVGNITKALRDDGSDRDRDMPDEICGWPDHNPKVEIDLGGGDAYRGYLFNRSHLIAKSLGGADAPENMITGTRTQNVGRNQPPGGMAYTETLARDWLDAHPDGTVLYMATPNYQGDELLPRTVTVDIRTSDGAIDQHVTVYNTADGYGIDYLHGGVL